VSDLSPLLAFALTALVIEITPGPNMTYLAALSLSRGMRTGFAAVAGIALGLMTYGVIAAFGLAAAIDHSPWLYGLLRWGGVAYLLWLAWDAWSGKEDASPGRTVGADARPWPAFRRGLITNLLNPKVGVFYVALLPQFLPPGSDPLAVGLLLAGVHAIISVVWFAVLITLAAALGRRLRRPSTVRAIGGVTGTTLVGFGVKLAVTS
jgi:RhtB (resistance to homoserine/threonine) family protein